MSQPVAAREELRFGAGAELEDVAPLGGVALAGAEAEALVVEDGPGPSACRGRRRGGRGRGCRRGARAPGSPPG